MAENTSFAKKVRNFFGFYAAGPKPVNKRQQLILQTRYTPEDSQKGMSLERSQNVSHDAAIYSAVGKAVARSIRLGVIGSGINLRSEIKRRNANRETKEKKLNDRLNTAIEAAWKEWGQACSLDGLHSWHVMTEKMLTSMVVSGDCFIRLHNIPAENRVTGYKSKVKFSIEVVEGDMIDTNYHGQINSDSDQYWLGGIKYDKYNRPLTYAVKVIQRGVYNTALIPAREMIPVRMDGELRPNSRRGWPWITPVAFTPDRMETVLKAHAGHTESAAAYNTYLVPPEHSGYDAPFEDETEEEREKREQAIGKQYQNIIDSGNRGGGFKVLPAGTEVKERTQIPPSQIDEFVLVMLRQVSLAIGVTYERLALDFSKSNFSSSRLSSIMDSERFSEIRKVLTNEVFDVIFKRWLTKLLLTDKFRQESQDLSEYEHTWTVKKQSSVDPQKSIAAASMAYKLGIVSKETIATELGYDYPSEQKTRVKNQDFEDSLGLKQPVTAKEVIEVDNNNNASNQPPQQQQNGNQNGSQQ